MSNVALVGLGPHAKRIYLNCLKKNAIVPTLFIEIEENREAVLKYIHENKLSTKTYFISSDNRDLRILSNEDQANLKNIFQKLNITHAIISTEPKAHFAYICFFLKNNIHILVDKPFTAIENVSTNIEMAKQIELDYEIILDLFNKVKINNVNFQLQCQRRWHKGYIFAHKTAQEIVHKYNVPITSIQISHCDGMWNMPDEFLNRENHPYKYGYGKLLHSGFHFIDLIAWFEDINNIIENKKPHQVQLCTAAVRPNDFMHIINKEDYQNLLNTHRFDNIFDNIQTFNFEKYGELDVYSIMQFKKNGQAISTACINLMQNGFSRRSWDTLPEDTYKGNGRVRHEYMNIEIGPLMNIQIHSYQSKEIKDSVKGAIGLGEVEHFDIYIFRNIDLIGGEPCTKFTLNDLYNEEDIILGFNETARDTCFKAFINNKKQGVPIHEYALSVRLLSKCYESICNSYNSKSPYLEFDVPTFIDNN